MASPYTETEVIKIQMQELLKLIVSTEDKINIIRHNISSALTASLSNTSIIEEELALLTELFLPVKQLLPKISERLERLNNININNGSNEVTVPKFDNAVGLKIQWNPNFMESFAFESNPEKFAIPSYSDPLKLKYTANESKIKCFHKKPIPAFLEKSQKLSKSKCKKNKSCLICGRNFSSNMTLNHHTAKYHKKSFKKSCNICGFKCVTLWTYKEHLNTHSVCYFCKKPCMAKDVLYRHLYTHTNEKPYFCHLCPFASTTRFRLTKHLESHSRNRRKLIKSKSTSSISFHAKALGIKKSAEIKWNTKDIDMKTFVDESITEIGEIAQSEISATKKLLELDSFDDSIKTESFATKYNQSNEVLNGIADFFETQNKPKRYFLQPEVPDESEMNYLLDESEQPECIIKLEPLDDGDFL